MTGKRHARQAVRNTEQATHRIVYRTHHHPHQTQSLTVTLPATEILDTRRAAGIIALRTGITFDHVRVLRISADSPTPSRRHR